MKMDLALVFSEPVIIAFVGAWRSLRVRSQAARWSGQGSAATPVLRKPKPCLPVAWRRRVAGRLALLQAV